MKKLDKKVWYFVILVCTVCLTLFPNIFSKGRIVVQSDMAQNSLTFQGDSEWGWNNKGEFFSVYAHESLFSQDEVSFSISLNGRNNTFDIKSIELFFGNFSMLYIDSSNFGDFCHVEDYVIQEGNISFNASNVDISVSLKTVQVKYNIYKFIFLLIHALMIYSLYMIRTNIRDGFMFAVYKVKTYERKKYENFARAMAGCFGIAIVLAYFTAKYELVAKGELGVIFVGYLIVSIVYCKYCDGCVWKAMGFSLASIYPIYLAVERLSSYLLVDEPRAINEQLYLQEDALRHWYFGYSRVNYSVMGTILRDIPEKVLEIFNITEIQYAKLVHCAIGLLIVVFLAYIISEKCVCKDSDSKQIRQVDFWIIFVALLSVPLLLNTLKFYNYDTFACLLGAVGCVYLYLSIRDESVKYAIISLIVISFALEEKNIVAPYWFLAYINGIYQQNRKNVDGDKRLHQMKLFGLAAFNMLISVIVFYVTNVYVSVILRNSFFSNANFADIVSPLTALFTKLFNVFGINVQSEVLLHVIIVAGLVFVGYVSVNALNVVITLTKKWKPLDGKIIFAVVVALCVIGVICVYKFKIFYMAPSYPNEEGYYISSVQMTAVTAYFPVETMFGNILFFIGSLYGLMFANIPTIMLLMFIFSYAMYKKQAPDYILDGLGAFSLVAVPVAYGVLGLSPIARYVNIYVIVLCMCMLIKSVRVINYFMQKVNMRKVIMFAVPLMTLNFAELSGFGPLYYAFWPVWDIVPYEYEYLETGQVVVGWQGGVGEHIAMAGEEIQQYCEENNMDFSQVSILTNYHGTWLSEYNSQVGRIPGWRKSASIEYPSTALEDYDFSETTFYVFSRWGITWESLPFDIPRNIEPIISIDRRGCTEVWIYSGPQMQTYLKSLEGIQDR